MGCPPLPPNSPAYVQSWLKEKQLSSVSAAAAAAPGGPSAASASIWGGSSRGSRSKLGARGRTASQPASQLSSPPAPQVSPPRPAPRSHALDHAHPHATPPWTSCVGRAGLPATAYHRPPRLSVPALSRISPTPFRAWPRPLRRLSRLPGCVGGVSAAAYPEPDSGVR